MARCFVAASVLTAYAPTPELFIVIHGGLGIAGATLMPSTLAPIGGLSAARDSEPRHSGSPTPKRRPAYRGRNLPRTEST